MTNWVFNDLTVTGPEEERRRFMAECFTMEAGRPRFDFDKLIPEPEHAEPSPEEEAGRAALWEQASTVTENPDGTVVVEFDPDIDLDLDDDIDHNRFFPAWYNWRCEHWGTRENARRTEFAQAGFFDDEAIRFRFDTAWGFPWPIYEELAARFPLLKIEGDILEQMYNFGGNICCHAGEIDFEDTTAEIQAEYARVCEKLDHDIAGTRH